MTAQFTKTWVRDMVIKPVVRHWGRGFDMLGSDIRRALIDQQCMSIVMTWATLGAKHGIDPADVVAFRRAVLDTYAEDYPE